jgi:hypothetical protein
MHREFYQKNLEWKDHLKYLRTLVRIILKWNLKNESVDCVHLAGHQKCQWQVVKRLGVSK